MNRIVYVILKKIYVVPVWFARICKYSKSNKHTDEEKYQVLRDIVQKVNKGCNVEIVCTGKENLPKESGYILFPNHEGLFDVLLTVDTHERPISFVIKKELENTILLKQVIRLLNAKALDRSDVRQSMQVIIEMAQDVKKGKNYIIFPEGTRSKVPNKPDVFKGGTFKSAIKAKAPIVPVALIDSYKPFDINSTKKVTVQIHYLKPLYYEEYKEMKSTEIANRVREDIIKAIEQNLS